MRGISQDFIFIHCMSHHINPKDVFIIIPAYNENAVIRSVLEKLLPCKYTIVVVDDGSAQNLFPLINDMPVYSICHQVNLGQGAALQTGIEFALSKQALYIATFDADGQHHPGDIENLLEPLTDNRADVVFGSRFMEGSVHNMPVKRKLLLQTARYINYFFTGLLLTDAHNGLRAMNRKAALQIRIEENSMAHATEILAQVKKNKLHYTEIPVNIMYTGYSKAKGQTVWSGFRIFFDILLNKIFK